MHAKAATLPADEIFLDLEDSVAPKEKEHARHLVVQALNTHDYKPRTTVVRVNPVDSKWCAKDIITVVEGAGRHIDCIMIPKVDGPEHVQFVDLLLTQLEEELGLDKHIGIEAQIETAYGMNNIEKIAASSPRLETLIFGPGDYAASLKLPHLTVGSLLEEYPGDLWHYSLSRIIQVARANDLQAIDGPYAAIRDLDGFRKFAKRSAMLGYDGKWALHPDQITILNEVFSPSQEDFDKAYAILEAYQKATEVEGKGAVMLGDEMIDEATRKMAQVMYERGKLIGMTPRLWQPTQS